MNSNEIVYVVFKNEFIIGVYTKREPAEKEVLTEINAKLEKDAVPFNHKTFKQGCEFYQREYQVALDVQQKFVDDVF